eukprot:SAG11_NODE_4356_length_1934_cov_1.372207_2_plen_138_part_00
MPGNWITAALIFVELGPVLSQMGADNSCRYAHDGRCDEPPYSNYCAIGTDCSDCGNCDELGTSTGWVVRNDGQIGDHWVIDELELFSDTACTVEVSTPRNVARVLYSDCYDCADCERAATAAPPMTPARPSASSSLR